MKYGMKQPELIHNLEIWHEATRINFRSPFLRMLHMKFGFDWSSGLRGEDL